MDASADASTVEEQSALAQGTDGDAETLEIPVIEGGDHGSDGAAALAMSNDYSLYVQEGPGGDDSIVSTGETEDVDKSGSSPLREQDRFLPIANVNRIMKKSIPKTGKIAKDAKECVQECVSEFISFITSEASERCHQEKRKTINGEDILFAMSTLGFDNYVEPLKLYLQKYRESMKGEKVINAAGGRPETLPEELDEDQYSTHTLAAANIITEQTGQQNIAYTSTYQNQIGQQIHYG